MSQSVVIQDAARIRRILAAAPKEIIRALDKANREAAVPIIERAKSVTPATPLSNWAERGWSRRGDGNNALKYDSAKVKRGYTVRAGKKSRNNDYRTLLYLVDRDAAGAILEVTGRKGQGRTPQGKAFVRNLQRKLPRVSRLLWRATDEIGLQVLQYEIKQNYETARKWIQSQIDRA